MRSPQFEPPTIWAIDADGTNLTQLTEAGPYQEDRLEALSSFP